MTKDERRNYDGGYYLYPKTKDERRKTKDEIMMGVITYIQRRKTKDEKLTTTTGLRPSQPGLMPDTIQISSFVFRLSSVLCSILRRDIFRLSAQKHNENQDFKDQEKLVLGEFRTRRIPYQENFVVGEFRTRRISFRRISSYPVLLDVTVAFWLLQQLSNLHHCSYPTARDLCCRVCSPVIQNCFFKQTSEVVIENFLDIPWGVWCIQLCGWLRLACSCFVGYREYEFDIKSMRKVLRKVRSHMSEKTLNHNSSE